MEKLTLRRTFNIGNYETISVEATAEADTLEKARLIATYRVLEIAKTEMIRIFNIRVHNTTGSPWDQVITELNGIAKEVEAAGADFGQILHIAFPAEST